MQQWLRDNRQHAPEGMDPYNKKINSQTWRRVLKRNGWGDEETDTEVRLIFPTEDEKEGGKTPRPIAFDNETTTLKPTHLKGLPELTRAERRDFIVISDGRKYPMMEWLRENPEHIPAGMHPDNNNSHSLFFCLLQKNGWMAEADDAEIRLIIHAEARDEETFAMDENIAVHGNKMISISVSFWTDGIATEEDRIVPKHAWTSGVVKAVRNDSHGIRTSADPIPFNTLMELPSAIEKLLIREGIVLHLNPKMRKYISQNTK